MKATWFGIVVAVLGVALLSASLRAADEKTSAAGATVQAEQSVSGVVTVTKDGDRVKQITIGQGDAQVCVCTSTEAGKKVADLAGKTVKATGTLAEKGGKKVITVTKVEEVKADTK